MNISLLHHLIDNTLTPEERKELMEYMRRHTTREEFFRLFDEVWVSEKDASIPRELQDRMYAHIIEQINPGADGQHSGPDRIQFYKHAVTGKIKKVIFSAAAACVAAALCILATHLFIRHSYQPATFAVTAELGQRASVTLPDGTLVWLNSGSCISYDSDYGHKIRYISLNGEASFDVAKDAEHPFIVEARGITTEALGTRFNISAYDTDNFLTTSLYKGSVRVNYSNASTILQPHQQVTIDLRNMKATVTSDDMELSEAPWRSDELTFNGQSLDEIAVILSRVYNTKIKIDDPSLGKECFAGTIHNTNIRNFIDILNLTTPIDYYFEGDTIHLRRR